MSSLSEYLRNRGLSFDPVEISKGEDPILSNEMLLKEATELWESKNSLIRLVLQARINAIAKHILEKATPEEVLVNRQSLVEIGAIIKDFEAYKAEYGRRKAKIDEKTETLPLKEGEEGSL